MNILAGEIADLRDENRVLRTELLALRTRLETAEKGNRLLVDCDSYLSLLWHRYKSKIDWQDWLGMSDMEMQTFMGKLRAASNAALSAPESTEASEVIAKLKKSIPDGQASSL